MGQPTEVDVHVEADQPDSSTSPDVVVVTDSDSPAGTDGDVVALLAGLSASVATLAERMSAMESRLADTALTADIAEATADAAISATEELAVETEEAVAAVAEEANADTPAVQAEVDDIAPNREHPWFRRRSALRSADR